MYTLLINADGSINAAISQGISIPAHPPELTQTYAAEDAFVAQLPTDIQWPADLHELKYSADVGWHRDPDLLPPPAPPPVQPPTLNEVKSRVQERLRIATQAHITGGLLSAALGTPHHYQTALTDQSNLHANLLAALHPGMPTNTTWAIWCLDNATQQAARRPHTAAQLRQLADDLQQHVTTAQAAHEEALKKLADVNSREEAEQITLDL